MNQITDDDAESRDRAWRAAAGDSTTAEDASFERSAQQAMPVSAFAISTPASSVTLDRTRQAIISFTATNTSGRALRGRAGVVALPASAASTVATQAAWLTLDGSAERDFPVGGAQQYSVRIGVPADAPQGQYAFRLDVTGVANPDEQYAQGPSVAFAVPQKAAPSPPPKPFPWWIVALVVALLLVGGGVTAFLLLRDVSVPNVVGQSVPSAQGTLQAANLALGTLTQRPIANPTQGVVEQTPVPGTRLARGSTVNLVEGNVITVPGSRDFAGVTVSGVRMSTASGAGNNVVTAAPNARVAVALSYTIRDPGCPGCIDQILIGFSDSSPDVCAYNGVPGAGGNSGSYNFEIAAPGSPGVHYLGFDRSQAFNCQQTLGRWWNGPPDANRHFAAVIVQ